MEEKIKELIKDIEADINVCKEIKVCFNEKDCEKRKDKFFCKDMQRGAGMLILIYEKILKKIKRILESEEK